ncbi:basic amino acid ABC transporter substrate-binding protein [Haloarcula mannanilytica]|uniref:Basic amino acid ABC transporter substrate-binding protein n=1 Tax=Haloarcula mannanilytica TaxID=2509225 RepID=A0A4C2EKR4_9EURY|nr:basic amino acid ABC transporter substrate-binding protein [Haloarcula mannanilytica]GCF14932.1 basic amino acid ABC transporter substrate-binding protein [Haloarcula mannanilytica]
MSDDGLSRRQYLSTVGGTAVTVSLAGCFGGGGGNGGDGSREITAGTAPGFPPFEMKQDGELVGFDVDLLEAVIDETDYTLAGWEEFEFKSLIPALTNDNIDVVAAGMTINDERDQTIDFTDPYYSSNQAIVVREDGDFSPSSLSDLSGRPIGAQKGTTGESTVQSELIEPGNLDESNYNSYGNYVLAVEDLQNGNIDAVVIDEPVAQTFAAQRPVTIAFTYETGENFGFGVREDDDEFTQALNDGLATVQDGSTYQDLTNKWFGQQ